MSLYSDYCFNPSTCEYALWLNGVVFLACEHEYLESNYEVRRCW